MDDYDYEGMPETSTATTHMVAGAAAGIMEHSVMYPIDCIKVNKAMSSRELIPRIYVLLNQF